MLTLNRKNFYKNRNMNGIASALEGIASLNILIGKPERAARLLGWTDATREKISDPRWRVEQADVDRDIAAIIAKIGNAAFEEANNKGRAMSLDEAVALALEEIRL